MGERRASLAAKAACTAGLAVALEAEGVLALPGRAPRGAALAGAVVAGAEPAALAAGRGEAAELAVLVHRVAQPVDARVLADDLVVRVNHNALVVLVQGILRNPVRVEHTQAAARAADALLRLGAQVAAPLVLVDAAVARLAEVDALGQLLLAAAAADAHAVDDVALLGLVAKVARLVRAGGPGRAVDHRQLPVLPAAHAQKETDRVRLLLAPELRQVLEGALRSEGGRVSAAVRRRTGRPARPQRAASIGRVVPGRVGAEMRCRRPRTIFAELW